MTNQATLLVECNWSTSYTLSVGADWTSGLYMAKLVHGATGKEHPVFFVVRDDASNSKVLFRVAQHRAGLQQLRHGDRAIQSLRL